MNQKSPIERLEARCSLAGFDEGHRSLRCRRLQKSSVPQIETLGRLPLNITVDPFSRSGGEIAFDVSHLARHHLIEI